jgi:hypothetical protein
MFIASNKTIRAPSGRHINARTPCKNNPERQVQCDAAPYGARRCFVSVIAINMEPLWGTNIATGSFETVSG